MRRTATTDELYFVTLTVVDWIDIFTRQSYKQYIIENLDYCQKNKGLTLYAYVLMSNHIHFVGQVNNGNMSNLLRDFKSFTSNGLYRLIEENNEESRKVWMLEHFKKIGEQNSLNKDFQIWQNGSHPTILYSQQVDIIQQKINYIHQNPVRAGIVSEDQMYLYSSVHPLNPLQMNNGVF